MRKSKVSVRGQTVIPQEIREKLGIEPNTELAWSLRDGVVVVVPLPKDPLRASLGVLQGKGPGTRELLAERRADLALEQKKLARWLRPAKKAANK